jgi:hypothetical protein
MNIHDKEILVEELEEHLHQVMYCTLENPFCLWLSGRQLCHHLLSSEEFVVVSIKGEFTYSPDINKIISDILSKQ